MKTDSYDEYMMAKRKKLEEKAKTLNRDVSPDNGINVLAAAKNRVVDKTPFRGNQHNKTNNPMVLDDLDKGEYATYLTKHFRKYLAMPFPQSDQDVANRVEFYFDDCEANSVKPTVEGLALAIGIARITFINWANRGDDSKYDRYLICKRAREVIQTIDSSLVEANKLPPIPYIFRSKNNYPEYRDNQEVTIKPADPLGNKIEPDRLLETIENDVIEND